MDDQKGERARKNCIDKSFSCKENFMSTGLHDSDCSKISGINKLIPTVDAHRKIDPNQSQCRIDWHEKTLNEW